MRHCNGCLASTSWSRANLGPCAQALLEHCLQMHDDIVMNKVFKQGGQDGKVQSKLSEKAPEWSHQAEVSSEVQVPRLEVSSIFQSGGSQHQAGKARLAIIYVRDPYFSHIRLKSECAILNCQRKATEERGDAKIVEVSCERKRKQTLRPRKRPKPVSRTDDQRTFLHARKRFLTLQSTYKKTTLDWQRDCSDQDFADKTELARAPLHTPVDVRTTHMKIYSSATFKGTERQQSSKVKSASLFQDFHWEAASNTWRR